MSRPTSPGMATAAGLRALLLTLGASETPIAFAIVERRLCLCLWLLVFSCVMALLCVVCMCVGYCSGVTILGGLTCDAPGVGLRGVRSNKTCLESEPKSEPFFLEPVHAFKV